MFSWIFEYDDYEYEYRHNRTEREYIQKLRNVYGNKYDYSKVRIINKHAKITLICKKHGDFSSSQYCMLHGTGCPDCKRDARYKRIAIYYGITPKNI